MLKIKKNSILIPLFVVVVLILSGSGLQVLYPRLSSNIAIFFSLVCIMTMVVNKRIENSLVIAFIFCFVYVLSMVFNSDLSKASSYYVLLSIIIISYYISVRISFKQFAEYYINIIFILSIISLFFYFILNFTSVPIKAIEKTSVNSYFHYHTLFIYNWIEGLQQRNCGPFWEPGIFATHLIFALNMELVILDRKRFVRLFIIILTVITCNSAAGFFLLAIVISEMFLHSDIFNDSTWKKILRFTVMLILVVIVLNMDVILEQTGLINNQYFQKLTTEKITENTRALSIGYNLNKFISSPLYGNGLSNSIADNKLLTPDTTTSVYMLNLIGIFGLAYSAILVVKIIQLKGVSLSHRVCFLLTIMIIVNKEPHYEFLLIWCLIFFLLKKKESLTDDSLCVEKE